MSSRTPASAYERRQNQYEIDNLKTGITSLTFFTVKNLKTAKVLHGMRPLSRRDFEARKAVLKDLGMSNKNLGDITVWNELLRSGYGEVFLVSIAIQAEVLRQYNPRIRALSASLAALYIGRQGIKKYFPGGESRSEVVDVSNKKDLLLILQTFASIIIWTLMRKRQNSGLDFTETLAFEIYRLTSGTPLPPSRALVADIGAESADEALVAVTAVSVGTLFVAWASLSVAASAISTGGVTLAVGAVGFGFSKMVSTSESGEESFTPTFGQSYAYVQKVLWGYMVDSEYDSDALQERALGEFTVFLASDPKVNKVFDEAWEKQLVVVPDTFTLMKNRVLATGKFTNGVVNRMTEKGLERVNIVVEFARENGPVAASYLQGLVEYAIFTTIVLAALNLGGQPNLAPPTAKLLGGIFTVGVTQDVLYGEDFSTVGQVKDDLKIFIQGAGEVGETGVNTVKKVVWSAAPLIGVGVFLTVGTILAKRDFLSTTTHLQKRPPKAPAKKRKKQKLK